MPNKKIALMVFSLSMEEELKNKPFLAEKDLVHLLSTHVKSITQSLDLPVIYYDESKQAGTCFGSRFSNALQDLYNEGYDAVISIGGDCPHLEARHICEAKEQLLNNNTVIGPTFDGGFYLLGIAKKDFEHTSFLNFSWNTEAVYEEVFQTLSSRGCSITILQKLRDIDYFSDIREINLKHLKNDKLRSVIQRIHDPKLVHCIDETFHTFQFLYSVPFNKGSPSFATL